MDSIGRAVSCLGRDGPLPVVVASSEYTLLLENWIAHVQALGITRFLAVAMDEALAARLAGRGFVVAESRFDGSAADFWLRRILIWQYLIGLGVHVVQSDVDAIWLRDPIPAFFADQHCDLLCSQGTLHPGETAELWGFVLCTGLMSMRPSPATVRFFARFTKRADQVLLTDDQQVMNQMLAETGLVWNRYGLSCERHHLDGREFHSYGSIIDTTDPDSGATIGLLSHALFPRLPTASSGAYVKHVLRPEDDNTRVAELDAVGCWRLPRLNALGYSP
jgi:hypothetical protein